MKLNFKDLILLALTACSVLSTTAAVCPPGWKQYYDRCFYFSSQRHRQSEMDDVCARLNATVWSSHSKIEMAWVGNITEEMGPRILYWTGLKLVNHHWTWVDGTPYDKNNVKWYRNQEGNKNSGDLCAGLYAYRPQVGQMQQRRCTDSWGIICTRSSNALDVCDSANGWHLVDGWCLKYFSQPKSWFDARRSCQDNQGDLTIYKNYNQLLDLYGIVPCNGQSQKSWIGLSDTVQPRTWRWINNDTMRYSRWNSYGNIILQNGSTCATTDRANGFAWEGKVCSSPYPYICNRSTGACPTGWLTNQDRCYQINSRPNSMKTWFGAKTACENQGTSLLIINSDIEQQFIAKTLAHLHVTTAWLAFSDAQATDVLRWLDGRLVTDTHSYQHFAASFPQTQKNMFDCGLITAGAHSSDARWSNGYCYNYVPYVCEMKITDQPYLPTPIPPQKHCDHNWHLFKDHCYYFGPVGNQTLKTWKESRDWCKSSGGDLVILNDPYEISYVTVQQSKVITAWIGMRYDPNQKKLFWVDNTSPGDNRAANETNFHPGEPDDLDSGQYCIQIVGGRADYSGSWDDGNCSLTQGFICEKNSYPGGIAQLTTTPAYNSWSPQCGAGWIYSPVENFCYQIALNTPKNWLDARIDCQQRGGDLASITGRREQSFIQAVLSSGSYAQVQVNFWVGATDMSQEGGWKWVDNSAFAYLNWYPGEPNNKIRGQIPEDCGELVARWNYQWNDQRCHYEQLYICKKNALIATVSTLTPPSAAPPTGTCVGEAMLSGNYSLVDDNAFAASSSRDPQHLPLRSRLYSSGGNAWSAKYSTAAQYIKATFFNTIVVKGIITAGRTDNDEWVTKFKLQYQEDYYSDWLTYNQPPGKEMVFLANSDSSTAVTNMIQFPFEARIIRLLPVAWNSGISLRWEILGCMEEDCNPDYGVSGPLVVDDSAITASNVAQGSAAASGRLHPIRKNTVVSCWRPMSSSNPTNEWIQVDLGMLMVIRGVSTQGNPIAREWVTSYKVKYAINQQSFTYYNEPYGHVKTLSGNNDSTTLVTHYFKSHFQARYLRIIPVTFQGYVALRFDVMVCPHGCKGIPLISGSNPIDNQLINASSKLDTQHAAFRSRLNLVSQGAYAGAWIPKYNDQRQYIQVDLGFMVQVTGVATQGASDTQDWTKTYQLRYSTNGVSWHAYYELGTQPKLFLGNWDNNSVRKHFLLIPFIARYVRLVPVTFNHRIAIRWELFGCPGADSGRKIGCFADDKHNRDLSYEPFTDPNADMWPPTCIHHCFRKGYHYAGIQNQDECYCGNSYGRYGPATDCTLSCVPKTNFFCGGHSSNVIYTTGLNPTSKVCPKNWKAYNNRCYILLLDTRSWFDARAACQLAGGDLAAPNNQQEQDFVYSLLQYGTSADAWIGLNDIRHENVFQWASGGPVKYTNWNIFQPRPALNSDEDCVLMTTSTGGWQDEACDSIHSYVCQREKTPAIEVPPTVSVQGCRPGWDGYRWSCYLFADSPRNWNEADQACTTFGAKLVRVDDRFEQAYLSSKLGQRSSMYWTDLTDTRTPGTYSYSTNTRAYITFTNWAHGRPSAQSQCVALGSYNVSGLWYNQPCNMKMGMVCEKMRTGYTSPLPPPTTTPPLTCDPGLVLAGIYCYEINTKRARDASTWQEAKEDCENRGGNLASFHSISEINAVAGRVAAGYAGYWIGLNDRDQEGGFRWTDGSAVQFTNFRPGEPNNFQGDEDCIVMYNQGTWNDENCQNTKSWICKITAGQHLRVPTTMPAPPAGPSSMCDSGWSFYKGNCYYHNDGFGSQSKSWRQARRYCQQNGSDLASISNFNEQLFIQLTLLKDSNARDVWLGLNEINSERGFGWSDKMPVSFMNWDKTEINNLGGTESCVVMAIRNGNWFDENCANQHGYVCKKVAGATPTPVAPTPPWKGFCPAGFAQFHNNCYKVFTQAVNQSTASLNCQAIGKTYNLASVNSELQNAFLITLLADMKMVDPWIGLVKYQYRNWRWVNQEDVTYTNWATGQPSFKRDENCVHMWGTSRLNVGMWNDIPCDTNRGYICQTSKKSSIPTPEPTPNICDVRQHYQQYLTGCYLFVQKPMTWSAANSNCNSQAGYLVSINNPSEQAYIFLMVRQKNVPSIWIGLNDVQKSGIYSWADSWPVMYTNWDVNEPTKGANEGCVKFNTSGLWSDVSCNMTLPSICKVSTALPPLTPPPPNGSCDPGWYPHGSKCYLFRPNDYKSFLEASYFCQDMTSALVSVHNQTVNDFLYKTASAQTAQATSVWTSLHKSINSGFRWTDNSPLQYTNWNTGEPSVTGWGGNIENCGEILLSNGKWNDEDCSSQRGYICEKQKSVDTGGPGGIIAPTPKPQLIPSILPPQQVPTPHKHYTGPPTPQPPNTVSPYSGGAPGFTGSTNQSPGTGGTKNPQQQTQTAVKNVSLHPAALAGIILGSILAVCIVVGVVVFIRRKGAHGGSSFGSPTVPSSGFENKTYRYDNATEHLEESENGSVTLRSMSESSS